MSSSLLPANKGREPINGAIMTVRALRQAESGFLADMLYEAIFIPEGHDLLPKAVIQDPSLSIASEYLKLGVEYLSLSVDKANPAVNLYKRLGYAAAGETATSLTMRKRLKQDAK
ncbi:hypothetical protein [Phaeodactylibacter xiamenensis]|uniref:hypothetical protein n=1 Tax=Phaeodactylibacter xiamenensis TaxID=1524460 RepID=UPI003BACD2C3